MQPANLDLKRIGLAVPGARGRVGAGRLLCDAVRFNQDLAGRAVFVSRIVSCYKVRTHSVVKVPGGSRCNVNKLFD